MEETPCAWAKIMLPSLYKWKRKQRERQYLFVRAGFGSHLRGGSDSRAAGNVPADRGAWGLRGDHLQSAHRFPRFFTGAAVCVPLYGDRFVLLRQYRHALQDYQYAFPRGFATAGLSGAENARKELRKEIGAETGDILKLGSVVADSGLSGGEAQVFLCHVTRYVPQPGHEGITDTVTVSRQELAQMIRAGQITDGFTLSAYSLLTCAQDRS